MNTCIPLSASSSITSRRYCHGDFDLWSVFNRIPDRRSKYGRRYPLPALLLIALAAMLCGRKNQASIARWAGYLQPHELAALGIRCRRAPCRATWCMFFQSLRADDLEECLGRWVRASARSGLGHIAIDGKCLRGSWEGGKRVTHLLAAFSENLQGVVATAPVPSGRTELCAMMTLLKRFPLPGAIITADAAFTRARVAKAITKGGGDYFLIVKGNHKALRDNIAAAFHGIPYRDFLRRGWTRQSNLTGGTGGKNTGGSKPCLCPRPISIFPALRRCAGLLAVGVCGQVFPRKSITQSPA